MGIEGKVTGSRPERAEQACFPKNLEKEVLTVTVAGDIISARISENPDTSKSQAAEEPRQALGKGN